MDRSSATAGSALPAACSGVASLGSLQQPFACVGDRPGPDLVTFVMPHPTNSADARNHRATAARTHIMRIAVFGANGGTGRLLTQQALEAGHDVVAVLRRPAQLPLVHERLTVVEADVHDVEAVARAVAGSEAVLSTLGVPFTRKPIKIYSAGIVSIGA